MHQSRQSFSRIIFFEIAIFRQLVSAGRQNVAGFLTFSTFLSDLHLNFRKDLQNFIVASTNSERDKKSKYEKKA
jgi:hypothetical protein